MTSAGVRSVRIQSARRTRRAMRRRVCAQAVGVGIGVKGESEPLYAKSCGPGASAKTTKTTRRRSQLGLAGQPDTGRIQHRRSHRSYPTRHPPRLDSRLPRGLPAASACLCWLTLPPRTHGRAPADHWGGSTRQRRTRTKGLEVANRRGTRRADSCSSTPNPVLAPMPTHTLSPLIMYSPSGIISTPCSAENSRSTQSARMRLVRTSKPLSLPWQVSGMRRGDQNVVTE